MRSNKASNGIAVVACSEVIAAGLGIAFFAAELVVVADAQVGDNALAAEGIVIRFFFDVPQGVGHYIRRAQVIAKVERVSACRVITGCALAAEEDVFVRQSTVQVGLFQHLAARPLPVKGTATPNGAALGRDSYKHQRTQTARRCGRLAGPRPEPTA